MLKVHTPSVPATPTKRPRKAEDSPGPSAAFWDIKAKAKSKGKQVHGDLSDTTSPQVSYGRKGKHGEVAAEPILSMLKSKSTKHGTVANEQTAQHDTSSLADGLAQPPPRKKRRLTHDTSSPRHTLRSAASMSDLTAYAGPVNALSFRPPKAAFANTPQPPLSPVKHPVTRVKLIVRKPPTILSNPEQKPKPPLFGGSVDALLTSFIYRYDREANQDEIDAELTEELGLWRRVDHLRRQGRFLDRSSYTFVGAPPKDAWAGIVAEIERPGPRLVDAREMAANVAGKVLKYWEGENKAEEARMRSVARQTLHFVIAQWKKAVYVSDPFAQLELRLTRLCASSMFVSRRVSSGKRRNEGGGRSISMRSLTSLGIFSPYSCTTSHESRAADRGAYLRMGASARTRTRTGNRNRKERMLQTRRNLGPVKIAQTPNPLRRMRASRCLCRIWKLRVLHKLEGLRAVQVWRSTWIWRQRARRVVMMTDGMQVLRSFSLQFSPLLTYQGSWITRHLLSPLSSMHRGCPCQWTLITSSHFLLPKS